LFWSIIWRRKPTGTVGRKKPTAYRVKSNDEICRPTGKEAKLACNERNDTGSTIPSLYSGSFSLNFAYSHVRNFWFYLSLWKRTKDEATIFSIHTLRSQLPEMVTIFDVEVYVICTAERSFLIHLQGSKPECWQWWITIAFRNNELFYIAQGKGKSLLL
jgi:hypothetical protein